ncbi:hypothetical protein JW926_15340 [Candidatus Sumerlaeota bacterium]|nr:hypothetical protein [Candidatus Sumerlaeota bacterium]
MHIFEQEKQLTQRVKSLPDTYYFDIQGFQKSEPNLDALIFDAAEYAKDGLLPITEWMGKCLFSDRMAEMISDIWKHAEIETRSGMIPSLRVLENIYKYKNYSWEGIHGADGFADSIEGAINLVNRFPASSAQKWIEEEIKPIYEDMDCPNNVKLSVHPGGHIMDIDLLKVFMEKHLKAN